VAVRLSMGWVFWAFIGANYVALPLFQAGGEKRGYSSSLGRWGVNHLTSGLFFFRNSRERREKRNRGKISRSRLGGGHHSGREDPVKEILVHKVACWRDLGFSKIPQRGRELRGDDGEYTIEQT